MNRYILDSNIYINFYDRYYKKDFFPTFWKKLPIILNNHVVIPRIVLEETYQSKFFLDWIDDNYSADILNHKKYGDEWQNVIQHVQSVGYYKDRALSDPDGWAQEKIADPWIIGIANKESYTVVTDETRILNLSKANPSKKVKIPDICDDLQVRVITMNEFFKEVGLSI